jgi:hypothetical protein
MHKGKVMCLFLISGFLLAGCASRLGYPGRTVGIPTQVTLFSKLAPKPSLTITMNFMARDIWSALYQKKFEDVLSKVSLDRLQRRLNVTFAKNVGKATDLFTPSSSEVLDIGVDYGKTKSDPPAYSGYDFSQYKESIPTQYILALTIDEWGLLAAQYDKDNGPYILLTIQLIDKETSESLWKYSYQFLQPVDKDANELTKASLLEDIYDRLITKAVDQYFAWLGW